MGQTKVIYLHKAALLFVLPLPDILHKHQDKGQPPPPPKKNLVIHKTEKVRETGVAESVRLQPQLAIQTNPIKLDLRLLCLLLDSPISS